MGIRLICGKKRFIIDSNANPAISVKEYESRTRRHTAVLMIGRSLKKRNAGRARLIKNHKLAHTLLLKIKNTVPAVSIKESLKQAFFGCAIFDLGVSICE
ncbi:hypothetical protein [Frisingicoccus sp.]|uniref:hypothetical protein n=1 Tax=Frisingicoccus sp. TaxID=1918627 RepID=UPI003AB11F64